MPDPYAAALALDHTHCRAICDEIGDRLREVLKPEALEIPQRLRALLDRLAQQELAPSIVPSLEEISLPTGREPLDKLKRSSGPELPATNRPFLGRDDGLDLADRRRTLARIRLAAEAVHFEAAIVGHHVLKAEMRQPAELQ
jgi:hypothetical protein